MKGMRERIQRILRDAKAGAPAAALAVDVVELVNWVYADQRAHIVTGRGLHEGERVAEGGLHTIAADSVLRFASAASLGVKIDKIGHDEGELHPVAEVVHDLVVHHGGRLIVDHAKARATPPGGAIEVRLGPAWKDKPAHDLKGVPRPGSFIVKNDRYRHPWYCPLAPDWEPDFVAELRAEYVAWHDALGRLVRACAATREKLGGLIVTATTLPREPWCSNDDLRGFESSPDEAATPARMPGLALGHLALLRLLDEPRRWFNLGQIVLHPTAPKDAADAMQWLIDQGLVDRFAQTQSVRLSAIGRDELGRHDYMRYG